MTTTPIHVKFEHLQAVTMKREVLTAQMRLLKSIKSMRKYKELRVKELRAKEKLKRNMTTAVSNVKKLRKMLPKGKVPQIHHHEEIEEKNYKTYSPRSKEEKRKEKKFSDIEFQLQEIEDRLRQLQ